RRCPHDRVGAQPAGERADHPGGPAFPPHVGRGARAVRLRTHPRGRLPRPDRTEPAMTTTPPSATPDLGSPQRAANPVTRVLSHAVYELRTTLRNGEQLLLSLILPALLLVFLAKATVIDVATAEGLGRVDVVAPGVLALAVMSSAFTGQAMATGFDRRAGALRLFAPSP